MPAHDSEHSPPPPFVTASNPARRLVLIEDSEDLRGLLRELLAFCGHEVRTATTGRQGIELVENLRPDVVLIDIGLPDMDGYEVARQLRRGPLGQSVQLVAVTGRSEEEDRQEAFEAGFNVHLVKPVDLAKLAGLLSRPSALGNDNVPA